MTQYYSRNDTEYSGSAIISIPFSYIDKNDISVVIIRDEEEIEGSFTWNNASQITVTTELETGDIISVRRNTPINQKIVTYTNESMVLDADNLNKSQDQLLDVIQEMYDNNVTFEIKIDGDIGDIAEEVSTANTNANEAKSIANSADSKAGSAVATATSATASATSALDYAQSALATATLASENASSAVADATTAKTIATEASNKVDSFGDDIAVVIAAAEKVNQLEGAVTTATSAATTATLASQSATAAATRAEAVIPTQTGQSGKYLQTNGTTTSWGTIETLPTQTGKNGKYLKTDGTDASWEDVDGLPTQSGNSGKFLTTNGTIPSWATVDALPSQTGQSGKFLTTDGTDASWGTAPTPSIATSSTTGVVQPDNVSIEVDNNGVISIANLTDIQCVVETYISGSSWYRIWSADNTGYRWCEQGGACTSGTAITFLKEFIDTNYSVTATYSAKSTTGFTPSQTGNWIAYGYIADEV